MTIRVTVPAELEESIVAWAEEAGVEPSAMALKVLSQGVSRRRNLSTYAQKQVKAAKKAGVVKRGPGRPRKEAKAAAPVKKAAKRGRPPGSTNKPKVAKAAPKAVAKALTPRKAPAPPAPAPAVSAGDWEDSGDWGAAASA
jgi:hypothetical protein